MDEYLVLLDRMKQLFEEDEFGIRSCLGGDLLNSYIEYMKEEKLILEEILKEYFSLI